MGNKMHHVEDEAFPFQFGVLLDGYATARKKALNREVMQYQYKNVHLWRVFFI